MSEEVDIGTLPTQDKVGDDDYVLLWTSEGTLVLVNGKAFQAQYETPKIGPQPINLNGIYASVGQPATVKNDGDQGLVIAAKPASGGAAANLIGISGLYLGLGTTNPLLDKATANALYENRVQTTLGVGSLKNGMPMKLTGSTWGNPGAGEEWIGVVQILGTTVYIVSGGKVTIDKAAFANSTATIGTSYWWNGTLWDTTKPTAWDAFTGKIVPVSGTEAIVLPFKRRSSAFRPATTQPVGAGRFNCILQTSGDTILATTGNPALLFRSTDNGVTWAQVTTGWNAATYKHAKEMRISGSKVLICLSADAITGAALDWVQSANLDGSGMASWQGVFASSSSGVKTIEFGAPAAGASHWWVQPVGRVQWFVSIGSAPFATITDANRTIVDSAPFGDKLYFVGSDTTGNVLHELTGSATNVNPYAAVAHYKPFGTETVANCIASDGISLYVGCTKGIYRSTDGKTWTGTTPNLTPAVSMVNDIIIHRIGVLAATDIGVIISTDNGANWQLIAKGNATAIGAGNNDRIIAAIDGGIQLLG